MDLETRKALLETSLERAAEQLGDITPHVMERYYACLPAARQTFEDHHPGFREKLEGEMVQQVLYCLMEWYDCPGEIEIVLLGTVPHHIDTLKVQPQLFSKLISAVCNTIRSTIPREFGDELAVWDELEEALLSLTECGAKYARSTIKSETCS